MGAAEGEADAAGDALANWVSCGCPMAGCAGDVVEVLVEEVVPGSVAVLADGNAGAGDDFLGGREVSGITI